MDGGFIGFVAEVQDCIVSWCNAFRLGIFFTGGVAAHGEALGAEAVEEELGLHVYSCQDHMGGVICCVLAPVDAGTGVGKNNDSLFFAFLQHGDGALHAFMDLINPSVMPMLAVKHGFRYIDKEQIISNGIHIYPSWVFAGNSATRRVDSYSMHFCDSSWRDYSFPRKIKRWLVTHYPALFRKM